VASSMSPVVRQVWARAAIANRGSSNAGSHFAMFLA
jgi:hypothetical protein